LGDYRGTEQHFRKQMQLLQGERARERFGTAVFPAVQSRCFLLRTFAERGVFEEGDAHGHEAIRIAEELDHPHSVVFACLSLAHLNSVRGELSQAAGLLERAAVQCREWDLPVLIPMVMASLGHVYAQLGRISEGAFLMQQTLTTYESRGFAWHSLSVAQLSEAHLLADRVDDARAGADRALILARERGERGHEAWALRLLGDIAAHPHRPNLATAEAHYGAAMALASELEMRPLVAHCHLGLGKMHHRTGDPGQAHEHLAIATAMYREMGMTYWLEQAEAALRQLG
jgi:hypothetical protein